MAIEKIKPEDIEKRSFEIISAELEKQGLSLFDEYEHIIRRCIHTSADFDYAHTMYFSPGVTEVIEEAIRNGCTIVTDTKMALSGISKISLERYGGKAYSFIGDEDVAKEAKARGVTRSYVAMEKASKLDVPVILAIGNAPTALVAICDLHQKGVFNPVAVIGVPVGFVNVVESKELLEASDIPCIINRGRKGGSNIAACIVNAILYKMEKRKKRR